MPVNPCGRTNWPRTVTSRLDKMSSTVDQACGVKEEGGGMGVGGVWSSRLSTTSRFLADELVAGQFQSSQIAQDGHGDLFGAEKFLGGSEQVFRRNRFDTLNQFIEAIEMVIVHFLAGQVRHARGRGLQR